MPNIVDDLHRSASIVKSLGDALLPNGKSLSQALTIDGIPYWDVFAPELARAYLPAAMAETSYSELISQLTKPILVKAKYFIRDLTRLYKHRNEYNGKSLTNTILCLDFMPQQSRDVVQPVVSYLAKNQDKQIISLRDSKWPSHKEVLNSNEVRRTTWSFWSKDLSYKINNLNKQLRLIKKSLMNSGQLEQIISLNEPDLRIRIQRAINRLFIGEFASLIRHGVLSKHILEKQLPSLLIAGDTNDPRTRIYMLQCKKLGIPCLALQFGLINSAAIEWRFFPADLVAVWGNDSKKTLISHGISPNQIVMTGSPRNDSLYNFSDSQTGSIKKKLGIPEGSPIVLLASTFTLSSYDKLYNDPELLKAMKKAVFDSIDDFENIYLIVKPHPEESEDEIKSFASDNPNIIFIPRTEDIRPLIKVCDCFVSFGSTATMDAIISDKLVVCPAFPGWVWSKAYVDTQAVHAPISVKEINDIFKIVSTSNHKILTTKLKKARDKLIENWVYRNDGLGAQRIGNLALDMLLDKKKFVDSLASSVPQ
ncbi:MAG: CDP-glycerol glycerophosphotransferase family protein [Methylophilaceae bacterium]